MLISLYFECEVLQCQIEEIIGGQCLGFCWLQFLIYKGLKVMFCVMKFDVSDVYMLFGMQLNGVGFFVYQE